ncbi:sigma-54-dependent Fis family transcriptional regulator [Streptomyces sp. PT12]|uniref:sigma-54-dependent Fis family transcriptional regulator n=1 Tax=Streptomyces sp. PT12 TaxID=1510197 RepID=UPI00215D11C9|nr:helix-turn-helix domain-containing protein [Streptomyces sp. PT12]
MESEAQRRTIARARLKFLEGAELPTPAVPERVRDSWKRSKLLGIGIDEVVVPYRPDYDRESHLMRAAAPVLDRLEQVLAGSDVCVIVTDRKGWVRDRRVGEARLMDHLDTVHLAPGFSYAEQFVGTNGIGVALEERRSSVVLGAEHFNERLQKVSCAASPIRNPISGRVAGTMNLTCWNGPASSLMAALAQEAADDIARVMYEISTSYERALLAAFRQATHYGDRPVLCIGQDLLLANAAAADRLTGDDHRLLREAAAEHGHALRTRRRVQLTGGTSALVRCRRVDSPAGTAGHLLDLAFDDVPATRKPAGAAGTRSSGGPAADAGPRALPGLAGADPAWTAASRTASRCARERVPLLIYGEAGTGKAALARAAHALTGAATAPAVVDAADPRHRAEAAGSGTGPALDPDALPRALRTAPAGQGLALVLRHLDAVTAARAQAVADALAAAAARGTWIVGTLGPAPEVPDALLRLFAEAVTVPPLRHRVADLPALAECLLRRAGAGVECSPDVLPLLRRQSWPGNVGQLESVLRKAAAGRRTYRVEPRDLPPSLHTVGRRSLSAWETAERDTLVEALLDAGGNKLLAAQRLGISRTTIYRKMRAYGITITLPTPR